MSPEINTYRNQTPLDRDEVLQASGASVDFLWNQLFIFYITTKPIMSHKSWHRWAWVIARGNFDTTQSMKCLLISKLVQKITKFALGSLLSSK